MGCRGSEVRIFSPRPRSIANGRSRGRLSDLRRSVSVSIRSGPPRSLGPDASSAAPGFGPRSARAEDQSANALSRPSATSHSLPIAWRCLVTPCRLMSVFAVSCAIDKAPPAHSAATCFRRVGSPSAAQTFGSASLERTIAGRSAQRRPTAFTLPLRGDTTHDVVHGRSAAGVHAERFQAALRRQLVEAGFNHGLRCSLRRDSTAHPNTRRTAYEHTAADADLLGVRHLWRSIGASRW